MELPDFTVEHLKKLPLLAIVAFAARCARRVEPLALRPEGEPGREGHRAAIEAALRMAEAIAGGSLAAPDPAAVEAIEAIGSARDGPSAGRSAAASAVAAARAAATAWHAIGDREAEGYKPILGDADYVLGSLRASERALVDIAVIQAFEAAARAFDAVGYRNAWFVNSALNDYDRLVNMKLGRYPEPGEPIDPSPAGPLGVVCVANGAIAGGLHLA